MSRVMQRRDYESGRQPREGYGGTRSVYVSTNHNDLTTTLIAGELLRNHGIPVTAEGHGFAIARARLGQVEEALGQMNTGKGFTLETAEGCPL
jgi:hypothetical protein